jgi:hypothetical protein
MNLRVIVFSYSLPKDIELLDYVYHLIGLEIKAKNPLLLDILRVTIGFFKSYKCYLICLSIISLVFIFSIIREDLLQFERVFVLL